MEILSGEGSSSKNSLENNRKRKKRRMVRPWRNSVETLLLIA
jgi:hypothetical protein